MPVSRPLVPRSPDLRSLLERPVLEVAPLLLGATLRHGEVGCRITEVEAYDGANDPGSHAFRGPTPRNAVMFGPAGHLYVYFTYGMHWCANVVCAPVGRASAVLFRAGEIVDGVETARARRTSARSDRDLARGPARLCQALAIAHDQDGHDLARPPLTLELGPPPGELHTGPRVGLRLAGDRPWRFWLADEPTVSAYRPAVTRSRRRS
jgi:DNA-3-methyladenine glycosylase